MATDLLDYLTAHADEMRADLRRLVDTESPSDDPQALRRCATELRSWVDELLDVDVAMIDEPAGPHLVVSSGTADRAYVLLVGHFDTVWPSGTTASWSYREADGIATGPGIFDMKAGIVQGVWAIHALAEVRGQQPSFQFVMNSDEELQSPRSRALIERHAQHAAAALVFEPSQRGALKTTRKGVGRFSVAVRGRAAHAGLDPTRGINAIEELARITLYLQDLSDADPGTTVTVGVVSGGTRPNVVPAHASASVDVRVPDREAGDRLEAAIRGIEPSRDGIEIDVTGAIARPPMERTIATGELLDRARSVGQDLGIEVTEASSGGGSDGNFCAALGVPVLDGLGAVGGGAHADHEHVELAEIPRRAALVAGLLAGC